MNIRRTAVVLAMGGAALALIGVGVGATFTDSGTATENISVGAMTIALSSTTSGVVVSNSGHTLTYTVPTIQSSAAGSAPFNMTITATGTIPANVSIAAVIVGDGATFTDLLANHGPIVVTPGTPVSLTAGLQWTTIPSSVEGATVSITYTISATA